MEHTESRLYLDAGWDPALRTYYGQVWVTIDPVTDQEPDDPLLWVGTSDGQARTITELRAALGPYTRLLTAAEALDLELERAVKEQELDEDDLDAFLASDPTDDQLCAYIRAQQARRIGNLAQLEDASRRRQAAQSAEQRRRTLLRLPRG